jgi:hypothetical protein
LGYAFLGGGGWSGAAVLGGLVTRRKAALAHLALPWQPWALPCLGAGNAGAPGNAMPLTRYKPQWFCNGRMGKSGSCIIVHLVGLRWLGSCWGSTNTAPIDPLGLTPMTETSNWAPVPTDPPQKNQTPQTRLQNPKPSPPKPQKPQPKPQNPPKPHITPPRSGPAAARCSCTGTAPWATRCSSATPAARATCSCWGLCP